MKLMKWINLSRHIRITRITNARITFLKVLRKTRAGKTINNYRREERNENLHICLGEISRGSTNRKTIARSYDRKVTVQFAEWQAYHIFTALMKN